jgi:alpha-1,2-mannosyltransferase
MRFARVDLGGRLGAAVSLFRDADWLTRERVRAYFWILFALTAAATVGWIALSHDGLDRLGKPLGTDFMSFWAASRIALSGHPALVYDPDVHAAAERAAFASAPVGYAAYFYPPLYLLLCLPLALMPYLGALAAWLGLSGALCWRAIRAILGEASVAPAVLLLAFPGVFSTLGHGQNAFLTTALLGFGVLALDRRPILAGVCFGLLAFKPHLGLLIPVCLVMSGRWRSVLAAGGTVILFAAVTTAVFGTETWRAFFAVSTLARQTLEQGLVDPAKMQSVFAAVRLVHGPLGLAYGLQAIAALGAAGVVAVASRARAGGLAEGAVLACATLLASPFLLDYDLMILAIPMAWIVREARRTGFFPWEKTALFAAFVLPLISRTVAARLGVPLGPPVILALLVVASRRALAVRREPAVSDLSPIEALAA